MRPFNRMWKRIGSAFLAAAAVVSLAACGGGVKSEDGQKNSAKGEQSEYRYVAEYVDLKVPEDVDFYRAQLIDDLFYYMSYEFDEASGSSSQTLHIYSIADQKETASYVMAENAGEENRYHSVNAYVVKENGGMAVLESWNDYSDENNPKSDLKIRLYDKEHNQTGEVDVKEEIPGLDENTYINTMFCDAQERFYLVGDSAIYLFDAELNYKGDISLADTWISLTGVGKDGKAYASMYDRGTNQQVIRSVDFEQRKLGEVHGNFVSGNGNGLVPGLEGDFLVSDGVRLYEYKMEDESLTELLTWLDCDIFGDYVQNVCTTSDGRIAVTISDWNSGEASLAYLTKVKASEVQEKQQITLGLLYEDQGISSAAVAFNKQSQDYHVNIKYYRDLNDYSETAYSDAQTALNNDIISADCPDLIDASQTNMAQLASKGAFEDLSSWLDQSKNLSRDDYFENILESATYDGCLVYIPRSFGVQTVVGKTADVGEKPGWSLDDIIALSEKHPEAAVFQGATKDTMVYYCLNSNQDAFIDYESGKCSFDSPEFKKVLEFINRFPDNYEWTEDEESLPAQIAAGKILLEPVYLSRLEDIQIYPAMFNEPVTYVGYPTTDGSVGCRLSMNRGLAMTSKAENKEGAWEFIEFYLTREDKMFEYGFPSNKKAMQELIDKELKVEYIKDEKGELVLDEDGNPIPENNHGGIGYGDWEYEYHNCTEEEIALVQEIIAQATAGSYTDEKILNIITEEASAYFSGKKNVDEVAGIIQSRVQIYLDENN